MGRVRPHWQILGLAVAVSILAGLLGKEALCAPPVSTAADQAFGAIRAAAASNDLVRVRALTTAFTTRHGADPRVPEVLFVQGAAEKQAGQDTAARRTWHWLVAQHPKTEPAARALEQLILLQEAGRTPGERQQLLVRLHADFPNHPSTVRLTIREAETRAGRGDYAGALGFYRRLPPGATSNQEQRVSELAVLAGPTTGNPADQMHRAEQLVALGSFGAAARLYEELWQRHRLLPVAVEARYRQGWCFDWQNQPTNAIVCWQSVVELAGPQRWEEQALLAIARTQAFKLGQYDDAAQSYRAFLQRYPHSAAHAEALYQLAGLYFTKGDVRAARSFFAEFLAAYPDNPAAKEAKHYLAQCTAAIRTAEDAARQKEAETVAATTPRPLAAHWLAEAERLRQQGDRRRAYDLYERIVIGHKAAPEYEPAAYAAGECLAALDDPRRATQVWEELCRWKPASPYAAQALLALGNLYLAEFGRPAQAQAVYERLLATAAKPLVIPATTAAPPAAMVGVDWVALLAQARHQLGLTLLRQARFDQARALFLLERATRKPVDPRAPPNDLDRLILACETKRAPVPAGSAGAKLFHAAHTLDAAEGRVATADTLFTAQDYAAAARVYETAVAQQPGTETAAYALLQAGRCYRQLRQVDRALACYRQFLAAPYRTSQWADDALLRAAVLYEHPLRRRKDTTALLEHVVREYPKSNSAEEALAHLETIAVWEKDWDRAWGLAQRLLRDYPQSRYANFMRRQELPALHQQAPHLDNSTGDQP